MSDANLPSPGSWWSIHGEGGCTRPEEERFWCVVCWRLTCWCKGCAGDVDELIGRLHEAGVPMGASDPGICDECWAALSQNGELQAKDNLSR